MKKSSMEYQKTHSRKWNLTLLVVFLVTFGTFVPPMLSMWFFNAATPLIIVSGSEFVSLLTLIVSVYLGANVWQKHVEKQKPEGDKPNENGEA